ncbi:MAG: prenylated flavin chaperone LpdD [Desulfurispora sp.]|uniref:prenylated flavin chaperone LpdD n=1 Tax=Desulfurispora sp. TaxID=3014275 RepID=UPI00404968CC
MFKTYQFQSGTGKHTVYLMATVTESGIMIHLIGGEVPHLGAVVLSLPRPSRSNPERTSCTTSVLPLAAHKDELAAKMVAETITRQVSKPVTVAAGLHIKNATQKDIITLMQNSRDAALQLIEAVKRDFSFS